MISKGITDIVLISLRISPAGRARELTGLTQLPDRNQLR